MWFMDTPQPAKAKQTRSRTVLWNLEDLETGDFLEKPADLKQYGLAVPEAVVTIGLADGKADQGPSSASRTRTAATISSATTRTRSTR